MYECVKKLVPDYLSNMFIPSVSFYNLRDATLKLSLMKQRTDDLKRSFSYNAASLFCIFLLYIITDILTMVHSLSLTYSRYSQ